MILNRKYKLKTHSAWPALITAVCAAFVLTACGGAGSAEKPDIIAPEEDYGVIAPEEVGDEPGLEEADPTGGEVSEIEVPTSGSETSQAAGTSAEWGLPASSDNGRRVVYLILPSDTGFSAIEREIITDNLKEQGFGVSVRIYNDSIDQQTAAFADALYSRPAAIICDNTYGDATRASVQEAHDAGVAAFLMDQGIDLSGVAQGQLVVDRCGRAKDLVKYFVGQNDDPVNYVILGGCEEDSRSRDMTDLIVSAMDRYVQVTRLAEERQETYDEADAEEKIHDLLVSYPEANALICHNTLQTKAGLAALEKLGLKGKVRVLCASGDRDDIVMMIESGEVEAAIVEPSETLASMVTDDVFRYFRTGSPEWSERRYVMAEILTKDGIWEEKS